MLQTGIQAGLLLTLHEGEDPLKLVSQGCADRVLRQTLHHLPTEVDSAKKILPEIPVRDTFKDKPVYVLWNDVQVAVNHTEPLESTGEVPHPGFHLVE